MKYDEVLKTLVASTPQEYLEDFVASTNAILGTNYDSTTIKGTNLWLLFQINLVLLQNQDLKITAFLSEMTKQFEAMQTEINLSSIGMFLGIKQVLEAFPFVKEVGLKPPTILDDRGIFGLAIYYVPPVSISSITENQLIANALCIYAGAGIYTLKNEFTTDFIGIIESIGQPFTHSWRAVVPKTIFLKYNYHLEAGQIQPPLQELKDNLKKIIDEELLLGEEFKPQKIANHPYFRFYDRKRLFFSYTGNGSDWNDQNEPTNYYEKWVFDDDNIVFDNSTETKKEKKNVK